MVTVKTTKKPTGDKSFPIWDYTALLVKSQGGIIFMELENLLKVEYRGERVLSTKQIAILYGCSKDYIRKNFKDAKEHFVEGIHYFYLEGDELKKFKQYLAKLQAKSSDVTNSHAAELPCTKLASSLILWTEKGAVRHCKMVGTQKAWDVFTVLENSYFGQKVDLPEIETPNLPALEPVPRLTTYSRPF